MLGDDLLGYDGAALGEKYEELARERAFVKKIKRQEAETDFILSLSSGVVLGLVGRLIGGDPGAAVQVLPPLALAAPDQNESFTFRRAKNLATYTLGVAIGHADIVVPALYNAFQQQMN